VSTAGQVVAAAGTRPGRAAVWVMVGAWALTRALVLGSALAEQSRGTLFNDIALVWAWANQQPFGDDATPTLTEYPGLARLLALSGRLAPSPEVYGWAWIAAMLAVDLALLLVLARRSRRSGWLWLIGGAALGPVLWLRYDLLVAALAVAAVLARRRSPAASGVLLALAVLLKLWPLVLAAALLPRQGWQRFAAAASGTLAVGVLLEALVLGRSSVLGPLTYQSGRGLQVESLAATPLMWASRGEPPTSVWEFEFRAYQLQGTNGSNADLIGLALLAVVGLLVLWRLARAADDGTLDARRASAAALLATVLVAVNTVFSPQYVLWFLPLTALAAAGTLLPRATDVVLVALAALTQVIWPWSYVDLLNLLDGTLLVLAVRNALVVVLAGLLAVAVWRAGPGRVPDPLSPR
jgi:hypothetical protein